MSTRFHGDVRIVIGANYGDEGKGLMTDYFTAQGAEQGKRVLVVTSNGGAQRGHTVTLPDGRRHVFHHFGSGTFAGADTFLCRNFILNPILYEEERSVLEKSGEDLTGRVFADPFCIWSTPFDMIINQIVEEFRGKARHGSCGLGIWETIVRNRKCYIPFTRFEKDKNGLVRYLRQIRQEYLPWRLRKLGIPQIPSEWKNILDDPALIRHYLDDFYSMTEHFGKSSDVLFHEYDRLVFENGQGLLLDRNHLEHREHTTPSNTGIRNPAAMLEGIMGKSDVEVCYVTRTYLTRHGAGPFPYECSMKELGVEIKDITNIPNPFQGTLRYGKIDPAQLNVRIREDLSCIPEKYRKGLRISLAVTHLNESGDKILAGTEEDLKQFAEEVQIKNFYLSSGMDRNNLRVWSVGKNE